MDGFEGISSWFLELYECSQADCGYYQQYNIRFDLSSKWHAIITMEAEFLADIYPWWNLKEFGVETCIVPETKGVRQH